MNEQTIYYRNKFLHRAYTKLLKPFFFRKDPETVHDHMIRFGKMLGKTRAGTMLTGALFNYKNKVLKQEILGITFENPIGLSAGFDKNAELTSIIPSVGFGFAEVGSITGYPCSGNPKPRLWRLKASQSLVVYYGLKNDGARTISDRLKKKKFRIPVGISVAMTNIPDNADLQKGIDDYAKAFRTMEPIASYLTVNISCPNTHGGQPFTIPDRLDSLLTVLDTIPTNKPIFIKLSPDLSHDDLNTILEIAQRHRIDGIVCSNLTKRRTNPKIFDKDVPDVGGLSGKIVQDLADDMLSYIYKKYGTRFVLIGSGGVSSAEDAYKKIRLGASLIQMITGMIYEGPQVISDINQGLVRLLKRDGFLSINDAIGVDSK
jgi:dihydroorotate dehydrogenase